MGVNRLADGLLLLAAVALAFWLGSLLGHAQGGALQQLAVAHREQAVSTLHQQALDRITERHKASTAALRTELAQLDGAFQRTMTREKQDHQRELARLRAGAVRLSVPVVAASCAPGAAPAGDDPAAAARDRHEARAELTPAAAADLEAVAGDGDVAIHQLNACIDRYNAVRASVNALADAQSQATAEPSTPGGTTPPIPFAGSNLAAGSR